MNNTEIVKAFRLIAEGFNTLAHAFEGDVVVNPTEIVKSIEKVTEPVQEAPKKEEVKSVAPKEEVVESKEEVVEESATYTFEELEPKTYNEIKAIAKELGVKAVGTKKVIIDSILAHIGAVSTVEDTTEVEEEVDIKEVEEVTNDVDVEEDEEVEAEDTTLYDTVVSDLEGYTDEELADILSTVGISPKGKRQALLAKIVQAIEEGALEWEDSEESTEESSVEEEEVDIKEVEEEEIPGSKARIIAMENEHTSLETAIKQGDVSHKEILKYLKEFNNGKYTSHGEDNDIQEYIAIQCDLIDDEGVQHELADPYYVGDVVYCCGQELNEVDNDLYCEICGTTYEA